MSFYGLKSESNIITLSAEARLMPKPPALVESKNTVCSEYSELNVSISLYLIYESVSPSRRKYFNERIIRNSSNKFNTNLN